MASAVEVSVLSGKIGSIIILCPWKDRYFLVFPPIIVFFFYGRPILPNDLPSFSECLKHIALDLIGTGVWLDKPAIMQKLFLNMKAQINQGYAVSSDLLQNWFPAFEKLISKIRQAKTDAPAKLYEGIIVEMLSVINTAVSRKGQLPAVAAAANAASTTQTRMQHTGDLSV